MNTTVRNAGSSTDIIVAASAGPAVVEPRTEKTPTGCKAQCSEGRFNLTENHLGPTLHMSSNND